MVSELDLVIRRSLEKDPNDRYQTVHEMVDDILEVGAVRDSLAGFNPVTITAVPRQPAGDVASPVPSRAFLWAVAISSRLARSS